MNSRGLVTDLSFDKLLFANELQGGEEALGEVAVLQDDPEPLLGAFVDPALSDRALTLAQRDALHPDAL